MLCYRDTTFCVSENCKCGRKLTPEIIAAAERWWGKPGAPIAKANFCDTEETEKNRAAARGKETRDG